MAEALKLPGRRRVWCLRRLAILDDVPVALLAAWLPRGYQKGMAARDFGEGSLYDALAEVHGVEMTSADNLVEVGRAGLDDADLLAAHPRQPAPRGRRRHPRPAGTTGGVLPRALPT